MRAAMLPISIVLASNFCDVWFHCKMISQYGYVIYTKISIIKMWTEYTAL